MKNPKNMTTKELIGLADEIKRGMTRKFLKEIENFKKAEKLDMKKIITKNEAIMIADRVKSGMSIKVLNDLKELENARSKVLMVKQS
ncbi:hypothetical protein HYX00_01630 [Candidatus Woesearchaeota archaeon]|nr:hypothetical protein [Candidatus Woesearchaeota archaeon]